MLDQIQGTDDAVTRTRDAIIEDVMGCISMSAYEPPVFEALLAAFEAAVRDAVLGEIHCVFDILNGLTCLEHRDAGNLSVQNCPPCAARERARMAADA